MKQNKTIYRTGKFTDYKGIKRPFVMCAVTSKREGLYLTDTVNRFDTIDVPKAVYMGISICHESDLDKYDEEIGKIIAYGKAMKPEKSKLILTSFDKGVLTTNIINALLDQEEKFFLDNPEKHIVGYNEARIKYNLKNLGVDELLSRIKDKEASLAELYKNLDIMKKHAIKK